MATPSNKVPNGPATPVYILRGHGAPIHALDIFSQNLRLVSGDANGWIVIWDLVSKRPVTVWKAHEGAVLEVKGYNYGVKGTEIYTHGRDHKLCVWKIRAEDEDFLDKTLPVDAAEADPAKKGAQPWLLHSLPVNALNFCAFSMTYIHTVDPSSSEHVQTGEPSTLRNILFAVPNALDSGGIDIFHLPSELRLSTIPSDPAVKTGMVMAVNIFVASSGDIYVASAYEDGHVMVHVHKGPLTGRNFERENIVSDPWKWERLYASRPHSQPVLSIDVSPKRDCFISSSADALVIKHPVPGPGTVGDVPIINYKEESPLKTMNTKHSGQQGLRIRSDGKIFATAGWDSRVRVYSGTTLKELAVLRWHKDGCYSVAFGEVHPVLQQACPAKAEGTEMREKAKENQGHLVQGTNLSLAAIQNQRSTKIQQTHWLAAGSKDGKISLWDIY
ncbi:uncharacterized protein N7484_009613 [Penicillium longicatenatum]|uniref:uncharacterized protein n=1 Tax=Penicillium longicatenatum TaxID=1561947 RepID=UPI002546D441|nr:uncharacterized protein N7484_009613 [Penicillium longicatenatum]KAJ5636300.1 hypothetical protein N7484_009613 [Penicillium longicatenatum]